MQFTVEEPDSDANVPLTTPGTKFAQGGNPSYSDTLRRDRPDEVWHPSKRDLSVMMRQAQQGRF